MNQQKIKRVGGGYGARGFMKANEKKTKKQDRQRLPLHQPKRKAVMINKVAFPTQLKVQKTKPVNKFTSNPQRKRVPKRKLSQFDVIMWQPQGQHVPSIDNSIQQHVPALEIQSSQPLSLQIIQPDSIILSQQIMQQRVDFIQIISSPMRNSIPVIQQALQQAGDKYSRLSNLYQKLQSEYNNLNQLFNKTSTQSRQAQVLYEQTINAYQIVQKSRNQLIQFNAMLANKLKKLENRAPAIQYVDNPALRDQFVKLKNQYQYLKTSNAQKDILHSKYLQLKLQYQKVQSQYQRIKNLPREKQIQYYPDLNSQRQLQQLQRQFNALSNRPPQIQYIIDPQYEDKYFQLMKSHQKIIQQLNKRPINQPKIKIKKVLDQQQLVKYNSLLKLYDQLKQQYQKIADKQPQIHYVPLNIEQNQAYINTVAAYRSLQAQYYSVRQQMNHLINNPKIITEFKTPQKQVIQRVIMKTPKQRIVFKSPEYQQPQKIYVDRWIDKQVIKWKTPEIKYIQKWKTPIKMEQQKIMPLHKMQQQPTTQRIVQYVPQFHVQQISVPGPQRVVYVDGPQKIIHIPGPQRLVHVPGPQRLVHVEGPQKIVYVKGPQKIVQVPGRQRIVYVKSQPIVQIQIDQQKIKELLSQKQIILLRQQQLQEHLNQIIAQKQQVQHLNVLIQQQYESKLGLQQSEILANKKKLDEMQKQFKSKQMRYLARRQQIKKQAIKFRQKYDLLHTQSLQKKKRIKQAKGYQIKLQPVVKKTNNMQIQWNTPIRSQKSLNLDVQRSPFHTPQNQSFLESLIDRHQNKSNNSSQKQMEAQLDTSKASTEKQFSLPVHFHQSGNLSIVCCWQFTQDQLWIGTKITNNDNYTYYTHQSVHIPASSVKQIQKCFLKVRSQRKDQNGKSTVKIPRSDVYFIKDQYKGISFIGLRHCIFYNKQRYATRCGFNLLQTQFIDAMDHWSEVIDQINSNKNDV